MSQQCAKLKIMNGKNVWFIGMVLLGLLIGTSCSKDDDGGDGNNNIDDGQLSTILVDKSCWYISNNPGGEISYLEYPVILDSYKIDINIIRDTPASYDTWDGYFLEFRDDKTGTYIYRMSGEISGSPSKILREYDFTWDLKNAVLTITYNHNVRKLGGTFKLYHDKDIDSYYLYWGADKEGLMFPHI